MAQFCSQCGNPLAQCTCSAAVAPSGTLSGMKARMGIDEPTGSQADIYERGRKIVPESIAQDEGEIPVRQYDVAILRTRWQFKRAEGRMQVTNKRVIFRANGKSLMGRTLFQQEFAISEIGGLDLRRDWRFGGFDFIFGALVALLVNAIFGGISGLISNDNIAAGITVALLFGLPLLVPFFILKKRFFLKMLSCAASVGLFTGVAGGSFLSSLNPFGRSYYGRGSDGSFMLIFVVIALVVELIALFLFSFKENLSITVKGKGGVGEAILVQADMGSGLLAKLLGRGNSGVNCGFSEVLPTSATDTAIREVGAMINDIQALGDFGIEKWKVE